MLKIKLKSVALRQAVLILSIYQRVRRWDYSMARVSVVYSEVDYLPQPPSQSPSRTWAPELCLVEAKAKGSVGIQGFCRRRR